MLREICSCPTWPYAVLKLFVAKHRIQSILKFVFLHVFQDLSGDINRTHLPLHFVAPLANNAAHMASFMAMVDNWRSAHCSSSNERDSTTFTLPSLHLYNPIYNL